MLDGSVCYVGQGRVFPWECFLPLVLFLYTPVSSPKGRVLLGSVCQAGEGVFTEVAVQKEDVSEAN